VNDDHTVRSQPIQVAQIQDGLATIDQGLAAGARVVLDGQYKLKPGARVAEVAAVKPDPANAMPVLGAAK
jgi:multidrug efflux system membrane fusion protein